MRAVIQRVDRASVEIEGETVSQINKGLLILLGIEESDSEDDVNWLSNKVCNLRIFNDMDDVMNLSLIDISGEAIIVSQFTLHAKTKKGNRPSYIKAAHPDKAIPLYNSFITKTEEILGKKIGSGKFGAMMNIDLINSGPVTIIIDTKNKE